MMGLSKRYIPTEVEPRLQRQWQEAGIYQFDRQPDRPVYSIDTPPPTVSGYLHLGHVYSYTHPDLVARFWRMRGYNVFYPMGYDDNGLPTERLVEKRLGISAPEVGRTNFIQKCLEISEEAEKDYQALWQRLGLSIDWRYTYRSIDDYSQRTAQLSFIELYRSGLAYRRESPAIWCPECQTSIAQAELNDLERESEFVTLKFYFEPGNREEEYLSIATTRPELLPACVAVFVHPDDARYQNLVGRKVRVPLFDQQVPILADPGANPEIGTGAVMCCTFGDTTDVAWWYTHKLPLIQAIDQTGRMTTAAGAYAGSTAEDARRQIKHDLDENHFITGRQPTSQSVRTHERCDTPVEYLVTRQWFIRVLEFKEKLLQAGERVNWHPAYMKARYRAWVENLNWDWCISRQRYFGVPIPVWYCQACGEVILPDADQLPIDPSKEKPQSACTKCGGDDFTPEKDILDTWATSSMSPQIVGRWLEDEHDTYRQDELHDRLYSRVFPFSLRPQAHEIIRTWAFYTIVKSDFHFNSLPWSDVLISGWGIAGEGMGKISKSRGGGPMAPLEMIERYSADAVRYWASSTNPGKDSVISEEKIQNGTKLVTKLWNVARFSERFLAGYKLPESTPALSPADRWILAGLQSLIRRVTQSMESYEYASARSEIEIFFWQELADNYLEMCKQRLYDEAAPLREGALFSLYQVLLAILKLLALFLPYATEEIYQGMFANRGSNGEEEMNISSGQTGFRSIHNSPWPEVEPRLENDSAGLTGQILVEIATAVRRYKSENNLPLSTQLDRLQLAIDPRKAQEQEGKEILEELARAEQDLTSVTRAQNIEVVEALDPGFLQLKIEGPVQIAIGG